MIRKSNLSRIGAAFLLLSLAAACGSTNPIRDTVAPKVLSTTASDGATGVPRNASIVGHFSEKMHPATLTTATFTLTGPGVTPVSGAVAHSGIHAIFTPSANLAAGTLFEATITTGAKDLAGNALVSDYTWSFTTGAALDTTAPTVPSSTPVDGTIGIPRNTNVIATFSEEMNPATLTTATFKVTGPGATPVSGAITYSGTHAIFTPFANLAASTLFEATITTGAKDLAGNALASAFTWSFTTGASAPEGPAPVLLGTAGNFVILAKSGIDTVPTSAITGDIGVSPIDSTAITGFSLVMDASNVFSTSSQVTGNVYAADYTPPTPSNLTTAVSDMETAYVDAAGRPIPDFTELGAGEIGGLVLVPGLYKWGTGVSIATDVTLDGGANDVWIFQIAGGLTQANGTTVHLTGGAVPENIFWQAFGQVNIGTTAHFEGIALCQTAIILGTGASVNGRLLAQTAVNIDSSTVVEP